MHGLEQHDLKIYGPKERYEKTQPKQTNQKLKHPTQPWKVYQTLASGLGWIPAVPFRGVFEFVCVCCTWKHIHSQTNKPSTPHHEKATSQPFPQKFGCQICFLVGWILSFFFVHQYMWNLPAASSSSSTCSTSSFSEAWDLIASPASCLFSCQGSGGCPRYPQIARLIPWRTGKNMKETHHNIWSKFICSRVFATF